MILTSPLQPDVFYDVNEQIAILSHAAAIKEAAADPGVKAALV